MAVGRVHVTSGLLFPWEGRWGVGTEGLEPSLPALMDKGSSDSGRSLGEWAAGWAPLCLGRTLLLPRVETEPCSSLRYFRLRRLE